MSQIPPVAAESPIPTYVPRRQPRLQMLSVRGGQIGLTRWGESEQAPIVLLHGWMDSGLSYQLLVDCLPDDWSFAAIDWRGYGRSDNRTDYYWLPDNFADLEAALELLSPQQPARLIGHSLGGTVASVYAGVRPARLAWLVNIEGMGLWRSNAPAVDRLAHWLDAQRELAAPKLYSSLDELTARIVKRHKRLRPDRARFLARAWTRERDGQYEIAADPKHQLISPLRFRTDDIEESWARIRCPLLLLHGAESDFLARAGGEAALQRWRRLIAGLEVGLIEGAGHMVQHEQPERAAAQIVRFVRERGERL